MITEEIKSRIINFPTYRRSPRLILEPPSEAVKIKKPPAKANIGKSSLVQIIVTPLIMLAITVGIGVLLKRGLYMMMGVASTVATSVFSVYRYISEKKECRIKNEKREKVYTDYLLDTRKELFNLRNKESDCYSYNSPKLSDIEKMINGYSSRIYEKTYSDADFMSVTVGYCDSESSAPVSFDYDELSVEKDELDLEAKELADEYTLINDKPVMIDLKNAHLGLVGSEAIVHEQLHILLSKLVVMQSYHDLEIILIINSKDRAEFDYMKWYPHVMLDAIGTGGIIDNGAIADQVLLSMHKIIKERELSINEKNKDTFFVPHFLFVIDDNRLVADHVIQEYLGKEEKYGFSIIYTSNMQENLPENMGTIIKYADADNATLVMNEKVVVNKRFKTDRLNNENLEWMARNLSVLNHEQGIIMHLPESVSFFEMYKVQSPAQLDIMGRWEKNSSNKSLAVPLGIRVTGEPMMLNLHEKAHGPHGLIAGTTGSGKSEIIQSYILSLAVNFHPYEVAFLLIDYKGGGMAHLFKDLPHVLGTITNLDADESMRALVSIKSELSRRQRIFMDYDVNHINAYTALYKSGIAKEPLPHLFIISDEFAELKKEQPEFMTELVSTARLGRSLGIHLILATQKPSGVVTDQIWTNSRFKLALKVQDESDSKEIIKTADAAYIRNPGRAYLQVGNNEIYELFQSAYSGAQCRENSDEEVIDNRIYIRNHLGQMELINEDLSDKESEEDKLKTQLDVTVRYINRIYDEMHCESVRKPWLESLPTMLVSPHVLADIVTDSIDSADLSVALGVVDIPQQQEQREYVYDFREDGNLAIFGAPGYGKSILLTTLIVSLSLKNPVELLNFFILDMGRGSLLPVKDIPHVADYLTFDDNEKLTRFMKFLNEEIKKRKNLFTQSSALNFDMYNRIAEEKIPAIIFVIDNYDVNKEMDAELDSFVNQVVRDGSSFGIYVVLTASRPGILRYTLSGSIKSKIAFYMFDKSETTAAVGKPEFGVKDIRGRALVKLDQAQEMQVYAVSDLASEEVYVESLKQYVINLNSRVSGNRPGKIKVMPEELTYELFKSYISELSTPGVIPIGLKVNDISTANIDLNKGRWLILGSASSGKTTTLKTIIASWKKQGQMYVIDDRNLELQEISFSEQAEYVSSPDAFIRFFESMKNEVALRKEGYTKAKENDPRLLPSSYYRSLPLIMVVIADMESFSSNFARMNNPDYENTLLSLEEVNIRIVAACASNKLKGIDRFTKHMKESGRGLILGDTQEQLIFQIPRTLKNGKPGSAVMADGNIFEGIKVAKYH